MYPILFKIPVPEFLQFLLPAYLTVHTYGFCIAMGIIAAYSYVKWQSKKELNISSDTVTNLLVYLVIAAIVGGKVFFFLEDPKYYFGHPANMLRSFSNGFVFYGSLIFAIPTMLYFFKKNNIKALPMLDIMAISIPMVHALGRMGCFFAGCCHGVPTHSIFGVIFTDPHCSARPLGVPLHPTQLYEVFMLMVILTILFLVKRRKRFDGQVMIIYFILYAIGRSIIEMFRGDEERGYIIQNVLSYAQFVSIILISIAIFFYFRLRNKKENENVEM